MVKPMVQKAKTTYKCIQILLGHNKAPKHRNGTAGRSIDRENKTKTETCSGQKTRENDKN